MGKTPLIVGIIAFVISIVCLKAMSVEARKLAPWHEKDTPQNPLPPMGFDGFIRKESTQKSPSSCCFYRDF